MKFRKTILAAVTFVAVLLGVFFWLRPAPPPPIVLPNPNGFDRFIKAGGTIKRPDDYRKLSEPELLRFVQANATALVLARDAFNLNSCVPLADFPEVYRDLGAIKSIAYGLAAEGRLALMESRTNDAAKSYLDAIRIGQKSMQGGLLIHRLFDLACEVIGMTPLEKICVGVDSKTSRELILGLEKIDRESDSAAEVEKRERGWSRAKYGLKGQIEWIVQSRSLQPFKPVFANLEQKINTVEKQRRTLILDLAAHAFELEKGTRPKSFSDLVPGYLKSIPVDPVTKTNLDYRF